MTEWYYFLEVWTHADGRMHKRHIAIPRDDKIFTQEKFGWWTVFRFGVDPEDISPSTRYRARKRYHEQVVQGKA